MTNEEKSRAEAEFERRAQNVTDADVEDVLRNRGKAEKKMHAGVLQQYWEDVQTFFQMLGDYWNGSYREVPFATIAAIVGALAYLICPIDVILDFLPVVGFLDDAAVIALCLKRVRADIAAYRDLKHLQLSLETTGCIGLSVL